MNVAMNLLGVVVLCHSTWACAGSGTVSTSDDAQVPSAPPEHPAQAHVPTATEVAATAPPDAAPLPPAESCEPCSMECLDKADEVKEADTNGAQALAERGCDIETCGYIGRAMQTRCHEYGLPEIPAAGTPERK